MYHEDIIIPNFERVEAAILGLQDDVGHVLLTDRNLGPQESFLGKVYLTVQDLGKYCPSVKRHYVKLMSDKHRHHSIQDASEMSDMSDQEAAGEDDDAESLSDEESPLDLSEFLDEEDAPEPPFQELLQAIVSWVKDQVIAATNDMPVRAFLLRAYSPKGSRVLMTSTFRAENRAWRPPSARTVPSPAPESPVAGRAVEPVSRVEAGAGASHASASGTGASGTGGGSHLLPVQQAPMPSAPPSLMSGGFQPPAGMVLLPANVADGGLYGTAGAFRALGDSYEQYGRIMVNGVEQLQGMMNQVLGDMGRELHGARGQVTSLVDYVLEKRVREVEIREEHAENIQQTDMKMTLAREAVGQLGNVAQSFFTARGIPPELAEVLGALGSSPELMASLQKPSVRALLQNPDNLKALATSLENIGEQQEQVRSVMQGPRASQPPSGYPGLPSGYGAPSLLAAPGGAGISGHAPGAGANPPQASWMPVPPSWPPPYPPSYPPPYSTQAPTHGNPYPAQVGGFPTPSGLSPAQTGVYPTQSGMYPAQPGPYQGPPGSYPTQSGAYPALSGAPLGWQAGAPHAHRGPSQQAQFPHASAPQQGYPQQFVDGYGRPAYGQAPPVSHYAQSMSAAPEPPGPPPDSSGHPRTDSDRPQ